MRLFTEGKNTEGEQAAFPPRMPWCNCTVEILGTDMKAPYLSTSHMNIFEGMLSDRGKG